MVAAGEDAIDALADVGDQPGGALKISLPAFGDQSPVHRAIWDFAKAHPAVALTVHSSDRQVDLVRDSYDLAIRLGVLVDSSLKARRIGTFERLLVASPDLLAGYETVASLDDLTRLDFIGYDMLPDKITLTNGQEDIIITPEKVRIAVNSISAGKEAAIAGLGVLNLPESEITGDIAADRLVEVLPERKAGGPRPARGIGIRPLRAEHCPGTTASGQRSILRTWSKPDARKKGL